MADVFTSTGIQWNSEIEEKLNSEDYDKYLELFYQSNCFPELFCTWEDYVRFCEFFNPDFFGID